jgi:hypothetical protein
MLVLISRSTVGSSAARITLQSKIAHALIPSQDAGRFEPLSGRRFVGAFAMCSFLLLHRPQRLLPCVAKAAAEPLRSLVRPAAKNAMSRKTMMLAAGPVKCNAL